MPTEKGLLRNRRVEEFNIIRLAGDMLKLKYLYSI